MGSLIPWRRLTLSGTRKERNWILSHQPDLGTANISVSLDLMFQLPPSSLSNQICSPAVSVQDKRTSGALSFEPFSHTFSNNRQLVSPAVVLSNHLNVRLLFAVRY